MKSNLTQAQKTKVLKETSSEEEIGLIAAEIVKMEFIPIVVPQDNQEEEYRTIGVHVDEYLEDKERQGEEVRCLTIHLKTAEDKAAMRERPYG
jgi:hypothetical protein